MLEKEILPTNQIRDIADIGKASLVAVEAIFNGMVRGGHGVLLHWVEENISGKMSGCRGQKWRYSAT